MAVGTSTIRRTFYLLYGPSALHPARDRDRCAGRRALISTIRYSQVDLVPAGDLKPGVRARARRDLVAL
jgi:hypothetical protein